MSAVIRTGGTRAQSLSAATPAALAVMLNDWMATIPASGRIMDIQYLFAQPEGDDESYVVMILYTTQ